MPIRNNVDFAAEDAKMSSTTVNSTDPFAADATPSAGVNSEPTAPSTEPDENNIDIDGIFDDNDQTEEGNTVDAQPSMPADKPADEQNKQVTEDDYLRAVSNYAKQVTEGFFKNVDLANKFESGDAQAVVSTLQDVMTEMYKTFICDASRLARHFTDAGIKNLNGELADKEQRNSRRAVLNKEIADYPALHSPQYKHIVDTVFDAALKKGKKPAEAAKMVVAYFKKNIPNAIQPATQTKQTDGKSINDDIWAAYR